MTKKIMIIISFIIITLLIALNIYMYIDSKYIYEKVDNNKFNTQSIVVMDKFRLEINEMCQYHKLYLLTGKEDYKEKYEKKLNSNYLYMEELVLDSIIIEDERGKIARSIDEYYKFGLESLAIDEVNYNMDTVEAQIIESNNIQENILSLIDKVVEYRSKQAEEENNTILSSTRLQKSGVQTVSTIIASVVSALIYTLKKFKADDGKIDELINTLKDLKVGKNKKRYNMKKNKINDIEKEVSKCEKEFQSIKVIYKQTSKINNLLDEKDKILEDIESQIEEIKIDIEKYSIKVSNIAIKDLEEKIYDLRFILNNIYIYNETISDFSKEIIGDCNESENKKDI